MPEKSLTVSANSLPKMKGGVKTVFNRFLPKNRSGYTSAREQSHTVRLPYVWWGVV